MSSLSFFWSEIGVKTGSLVSATVNSLLLVHVGILKKLWEHKQVKSTYKAGGAPSTPGSVHGSASWGFATLAEARWRQRSSMKSGLWAGNTSASVVASRFCRLTCGIRLQRWINSVRVYAISSTWASNGRCCFSAARAATAPHTAVCTSPQQRPTAGAEGEKRNHVPEGE